MRPRPWIEGAALLAAHDRPIPPPRKPTRWRHPMSADVRYALLTANPHAKPVVFSDIDALARHIQRERGLQSLELVDVEDLEVEGSADVRPGVTVYALDAGHDRDRLIGHAWLDGRGQDHLRAALRRNRLVIADQQEAA